jgi:signal transduction histidine kinase
MLPEFSVKNVKLKVSTDNTSLLFSYVIIATAVAYFVATKSWQHTSPIGFLVVLVLIIGQIVLLNLPWTKNLEFINSGGLIPLLIYNVALTINMVWYFPLYSPFILIAPPILFITVYYRGWISAVLSSLELILIVVLATHYQGLPHVAHAVYYPYAIVALGIAYIGLVTRAGAIENGIRTELGRVATHLSTERQQLGTLINSIGDPVIATDTAGNILFYNAAALSLFNTQSIKIGQPLSSVAKLYDESGQWINIFGLISEKAGQSQFNNFHILPSDNDTEHIDLAIDISRIAPDAQSQQESGFIFLMRDITKEKTLDQERDEFVSVTSHELRTPITLVEADISLAMLNQDGSPPLPAKVMERLEKAHQGIVYLANLTNQLITLSEAEKNRLQIISAPIDMKEFMAELETKYRPQATAKKLRFSSKLAPNVPALNSSLIYLNDILDNFLSNAIKYTDKGSVTLDARLSEDNKNVVISVRDTGMGISVSDKTKIFEKFYRTEDFHTRETGGAGLGLYMSRKLGEYLGAKIWFESELNKGSSFFISLKL